MIYDWFKLFNRTDFLATGLVSRTLTLTLEGIGNREVLITKGDFLGVTYEGVFLAIGITDDSPFEFDLMALYVDENEDVWLGLNGREE